MTLVAYAPAIHEAIAKGDIETMRSLRDEAEKYLSEWGNMPAALEVLRAEVAKLEGRGGGGSY
jgi:hypothetical protein